MSLTPPYSTPRDASDNHSLILTKDKILQQIDPMQLPFYESHVHSCVCPERGTCPAYSFAVWLSWDETGLEDHSLCICQVCSEGPMFLLLPQGDFLMFLHPIPGRRYEYKGFFFNILFTIGSLLFYYLLLIFFLLVL